MKKNLRIVSAAAAALLAVAPVAASAVSTVSADPITVFTTKPASVNDKDAISVSANINAVTKPGQLVTNTSTGVTTPLDFNSSVSGTITTSLNGTSYTANLASGTSATIYHIDGGKLVKVNPDKLVPGTHYYAFIPNVSFNFGPNNANKKDLALKGANGLLFQTSGTADVTGSVLKSTFGDHMTVNTDKNGVTADATISVLAPFTATDTTNTRSVSFFERANGNEVQNGSLTLNANSNQQLTVDSVIAAFKAKYAAHQFKGGNVYGQATVTTTTKDVEDQLAKQGMTVTNGVFTANKSFTLNFSAKSDENAYTTSMSVTVSVPNGKDTTPAAVAQTGTVKIMHAAYTYAADKDGKLTRVASEDAIHAYQEIPVYGTKEFGGKKFYRVSATNEWYINAGNVDGTSRTLNHNSYVYNNKGKRVKSEGTWKKGSKHTTYGSAMNIKGHRMYRVNKNRYVKVVNFDKN